MIDEDLVAFLKQNTTITDLVGSNIAVGDVPPSPDIQPTVTHYIWISLFNELPFIDLDGVSGLSKFNFDVECCSNETGTAKIIGRLVQKHLQGYCGTFGLSEVQAVYVESKDNDYVKKNESGESDITVVALDIEIFADDAVEDTVTPPVLET